MTNGTACTESIGRVPPYPLMAANPATARSGGGGHVLKPDGRAAMEIGNVTSRPNRSPHQVHLTASSLCQIGPGSDSPNSAVVAAALSQAVPSVLELLPRWTALPPGDSLRVGIIPFS